MCLQQGVTSILVLTSPMNNGRPVQFGSVSLAKSEFYRKSRLSTAFLYERLALSASSSSNLRGGFVYLFYTGVSLNRCEHMAARFSRVRYKTILWSKNRIWRIKGITTRIVLIKQFVLQGFPSYVSTNSRFVWRNTSLMQQGWVYISLSSVLYMFRVRYHPSSGVTRLYNSDMV